MLKINQLTGFGFNVTIPPLTLSFVASTVTQGGPGSSTVTGSASIQSGDILIYEDYARQSGSIPTAVTPSGFTNVINTSLASSSRAMISYKIATGAEASAAITGMNGGQENNKILAVFRPSRPLVSLTPADAAGQITNGDPTAQVCNASGGTPPLIVIAAYGSSGSNPTPRGFSPAEDAEINSGAFNLNYLKYKIYNTAPADVTVDLPDRLNDNWLGSFYLQAA